MPFHGSLSADEGSLATLDLIQNRLRLLLGQPFQHHLRFLQILCDACFIQARQFVVRIFAQCKGFGKQSGNPCLN